MFDVWDGALASWKKTFFFFKCGHFFPKNTSHNFPSRLMRFRTLWCTFTRFNPLFWAFTWLQSKVVDPCFIHHHELISKLFCLAVKIGQILLRSGYTNVTMDTIWVIARTFTFGSFKTISWILLIISGVVISFGRPGLGMDSVLERLQRNTIGDPLKVVAHKPNPYLWEKIKFWGENKGRLLFKTIEQR